MAEHTRIYDLGGIDPTPAAGRAGEAPGRGQPTAPFRTAALPVRRASVRGGFDFYGTFSLFLPGTGQMLRGEIALGLFYMVSLGFVLAFGWALVTSLDRVTETLRVLEYPGAPAVWVLCITFGAGVLLHLANILSANPRAGSYGPHPVLAGLASAVFPGWGQILNGAYRRACLIVAAAWLIAAMWVLAAPQVHEYLAQVRLFIPDEVMAVCSPAVRYTAPAVLWALAVYDAVATATSRRR